MHMNIQRERRVPVHLHTPGGSGVPRNFVRGGGLTNSVEDRENGDLGAVVPLVRGSGGSCNLVQEISFHIVKFSSFLVL